MGSRTTSAERKRSGGSDAENLVPLVVGPTPSILTGTETLVGYRTVLADRPDSPPSKRALRDAKRCARAGMVPGAMRKYLQTRKHVVVTSDATSAEEDVEQNNNDVGGGGVEMEENRQDGRVLQEILAPLSIPAVADEEDVFMQDDVERQSQVNDRNEGSDATTDFEEDSMPSETEVSTVLSSRKRHYSEAFSPDTTTPNVGDVNPPPPPTPTSTSTSTAKSPKCNNERFEILLSTPAKPVTISASKHRRVKKSSSTETNTSTSSYSSPSTSKARRNLNLQPLWSSIENRSSPYRLSDNVDVSLEKSLARHSWANVIHTLTTNLETAKLLPHPRHLGLLIRKALLGVGVRVPRDVPATAQKFLTQLVSTYPIDADGDVSTNYYVSVFAQSGDEEMTSLPCFLETVLDCIRADVRAGTSPAKALPFFKLLTRLVVTQYMAYERQCVKLHRPFFVRFLEEEGAGGLGLGYNEHCRGLLRHMFALIDHPDELKPLLRWIGLLSHHLKDKHVINASFNELVNDFVDTVSRPEYLPYQVKIVQAIKDKALGSAVCMALLMRTLTFEYVNEEDPNVIVIDCGNDVVESPSPNDITRYFRTIAKSELIVSLKAGLEEKSRVFPSPSTSISPPTVPSKAPQSRRRPSGVNMKGESHLHKLCARSTSDATGLQLERYLKSRAFPVNPRDNFGNTPLHDAVAHSRLDALMKFYEYSAEPSLPDDFRIDLLAQNNAGDNAFHLAASLPAPQGNSDFPTPHQLVEVLAYIGDKLNVIDEALKALNNEGIMPFQMTSSKEVREALLPPDGPEVVNIPPEGSGIKVASRSRVALQSLEVKRLIALWSEFSDE